MYDYNFASLSIILIEDQKEARKELESVLKLYFDTVYTAADGCEGQAKILHHQPDIIVTDIKMPCQNGIDMIKQIQIPAYNPIIIFTTAFSEKEYLLEAIDIQAVAYLIKPINLHTMLEKIDKMKHQQISSLQDLRYKKLSKREYQVLIDLANGLKPSQIAEKYQIKPKTVSTYRYRIFEKMSFTSNAELINYVITNKLN